MRRRPILRRIGFGLVALLVILIALLGYGYWQATQPPVVRRATLALADWPAGAQPVTVALLSDMHVAGPDMLPERLGRIVAQVNALKPDLILLAGDHVSYRALATRHYSPAEAIAPLGGLHAPLGVVAVLGNHDRFGPFHTRAALRAKGITLLVNEAVRRGPLVIGGLDLGFWQQDRIARTERAMAALGPGPRIVLSHAPRTPTGLRRPVGAIFAGHTHCGQIVLPLIGPLAAYAARRWLPCGRQTLRGSPMFVSAGLGTSLVPLRFGAPPDIWLVRLGPG